MTSSYEQQLAVVRGLQRATGDNDRHIDWCVSEGIIGLARTARGRIEIFLEGPRLEARFRRVRDAVEYDRWFRAGGEELLANRIVLPAAGHFEQVAAFLCTELLRSDATADLPRAFAVTEPLIDLAIEDLMMADETLLGLCGEMLVLKALLTAAPDKRVDELVESWQGHRETARDFQLGWLGVEVKTTTGSTSSHLFQGVHQLEVGHGVDGAEETAYIVVSLGLEWVGADDEASLTLAELVDGVTERIQQALGTAAGGVVDDLTARIAAYGSPKALGYGRSDPLDSARLNRRFRLRFARGYDMADEAIRLLTTDDLRARPFIDAESLHPRVNLPEHVRGDVNPVVGLANCAQRVVTANTIAG